MLWPISYDQITWVISRPRISIKVIGKIGQMSNTEFLIQFLNNTFSCAQEMDFKNSRRNKIR